MSDIEGRKSQRWRFVVLLAVFTAAAVGAILWKAHAESVLLPDAVEVTWINENMEQIDLTQNVRKEKIVRVLGEHGREQDPAKTDDPEPHKGDLEIRVKDREGKMHYFYLSHEGGEYLYYSDNREYSIDNGEELYQEVAAAL